MQLNKLQTRQLHCNNELNKHNAQGAMTSGFGIASMILISISSHLLTVGEQVYKAKKSKHKSKAKYSTNCAGGGGDK